MNLSFSYILKLYVSVVNMMSAVGGSSGYSDCQDYILLTKEV